MIPTRDGNPERSLLPQALFPVLQGITRPDGYDHAFELSLSRWRTSTAFLLNLREEPKDGRRQQLQKTIHELREELEGILSPYAYSDSRENWQASLSELLKRGERLGCLIFAQPALLEFKWSLPRKYASGFSEKDQKQKKPVVVFPAFRRKTDDKARRLESAIVVCEAVVEVMKGESDPGWLNQRHPTVDSQAAE